jgi:pilus assembly protein CpaC
MRQAATILLCVAILGGANVRAQDVRATHAPPLPHSDTAAPVSTSTELSAKAVTLLAGRSTLVNVGAPIARVSLTSADVADALVTSPHELLVHGKVPGAISMFVWDRGGAVQRYEIAVNRDLQKLAAQVKELLPGEAIEVRGNGRYVLLAGTVSHKDVMEKAINLASGFVDKRDEVVSVLQVQPAPTNQVLLKVRFAEVSRSALTEFGMSFFTSPTGVNNTLGRVTTQQFPAPAFGEVAWSKADANFGSPVTGAEGKFEFSDFLNFFLLSQRYDLGLMIRAMQSRGIFESLAEPNLVAESGKEASFLAGGEFPVPVAQGSGNNASIAVQFKEFGIRLNFVPTVIGDRVHLRVRPEVSTLDFGNAVVLQGFRIPALSTRRTDTELELRDGQTFAIAGLMNNNMNSTMQKIPGIGDIPILGHLFRSRAAQKSQTELIVMITPQILRADSTGVTDRLPRLVEPFMPPLPPGQTIDPPPPAFEGTRNPEPGTRN